MAVLNIMVWYHCARSCLVLSATRLFAYCSVGVGIVCGVVDRCTLHMPSTSLRMPSRNMFPFLSTIRCVAVNMTVHPSSHSFPMEISAYDRRWEKMCSVFTLVDNKGMMFSYAI